MILQAKRPNTAQIFILLGVMLLAGLALHFGYLALNGQNGRLSRLALDETRQALASDLIDLRHTRARLENKTRRLSVEYLDLELLDEVARQRLGLMRADELLLR